MDNVVWMHDASRAFMDQTERGDFYRFAVISNEQTRQLAELRGVLTPEIEALFDERDSQLRNLLEGLQR